MRDGIFMLVILAALPMALRYPHIGLLAWCWISNMLPHRATFGFASTLPVNAIISAVTLVGIAASKDRRMPPWNSFTMAALALILWTGVTTAGAFDVSWSTEYFTRTAKMWFYVMLVMMVMYDRVRIHALVWMMVMSMGYYGVKGGLFLVATAGAYRVEGPPDTAYSDNNTLALAVVMVLPLMVYLLRQSRNRLAHIGLWLAMLTSVLAILGSYSRGGFIALGIVMALIWAQSRHRLRTALGAAVIGAAVLSAMPSQYFERLSTIRDAKHDESFQGRTRSWGLALTIAQERLTGAGFYGPQRPEVYNHYLPDQTPLAAHSIYFQVLGEHGFIGLGLFLLTALMAWRQAGVVIRCTAGRPEWLWANDLMRLSRVSLVGYYIGGAALSVAYFEITWTLWGLAAVLYEQIRPLRSPAKPQGLTASLATGKAG